MKLDNVKRSFYIMFMNIKANIISAAEKVFDRNGFTASGMDELTQAANVSSRTLYKHLGSKTGLVCAVLGERDRRFREWVDVRTVDALFDALESWVATYGARGCLFLRALGETGDRDPEVATAVRAQKEFLRERIRSIVRNQLSADHGELADQIVVLFEGATASVTYRGPAAITAARNAARTLVAQRASS